METPYEIELRLNGICLPAILCQIRTDEGRLAQSHGVDLFKGKFLTPRTDKISNTLTGVQKDNLIMTNNNMQPTLTHHPNPTKEDLLENFSQRIRVRKMTPKEALRLMDFSEESINKIMNAEIKTTLKNGTVKVKKMPKTQIYKQAGNSIVCSCIYHIGRTLWIPNQKENEARTNGQLSLLTDGRIYQTSKGTS